MVVITRERFQKSDIVNLKVIIRSFVEYFLHFMVTLLYFHALQLCLFSMHSSFLHSFVTVHKKCSLKHASNVTSLRTILGFFILR